MQIHCLECFHQKFAPRCYACHQMILPNDGEEETIRIVALDRNYHPDCYRCEVNETSITRLRTNHPLLFRIVKHNSRVKKVVIQLMDMCFVFNAIEHIRTILDDH